MEQPPKIFGGGQPQFNDAGVLESTDVSSFLSTVFTWMVAGLAVTAVAAFYSAASDLYLTLMQGAGRWLLLLAPFAFLLVMNFGLQRLSVTSLALLFLAFAATMGISLGGIFLLYSLGSLTQVFLITAGTFAIMAIAGYTTKVDLSRMGSLLFMGLIGILLASLVNWWMKSTMLDFAISAIGVLIFTGLVAYDTQRLKRIAAGVEYGQVAPMKLALLGATSLYLDFLNLFLFLLRLLGRRD
ncbi:MAG: Bax inhibitor-1/YccA family protein [Bacteroidetes bacterium]|nr:Bax inhibitor-1/YccA family protein [Bacteroidota bacterium]